MPPQTRPPSCPYVFLDDLHPDMPELPKDNPADHNRAMRLTIVRNLDRLLNEATAPGFAGTVGVEISAKDGRLGDKPKFTRVRVGAED